MLEACNSFYFSFYIGRGPCLEVDLSLRRNFASLKSQGILKWELNHFASWDGHEPKQRQNSEVSMIPIGRCASTLQLWLVVLFEKVAESLEGESSLLEFGCWGQALRIYSLVPLLIHSMLSDYRCNVTSCLCSCYPTFSTVID